MANIYNKAENKDCENGTGNLKVSQRRLDEIERFNRELKHRRFPATDVNRKSKLLLFDAYYSLFVENVKL